MGTKSPLTVLHPHTNAYLKVGGGACRRRLHSRLPQSQLATHGVDEKSV